ncbi:Putative autophagy protein ATG17 [Septoria linicola]|uniref:Autophagy-related protein 17 n=1 Tax=Septoria linicola TaxID=215465 RepID=A0A9Q9EJX5_9PEZI|nr:putative autophagy protein ATG17 [Septoria linicola]USW52664.1 Putative autophagy protein ATG17 [Septoria linicola]
MSTSSSSAELSASPSPSPPRSPTIKQTPALQDLIVHFVDAKSSLSATSHVYRANELVTSSRSLIEEIAILNAKNTFVRRGLDKQVETLAAIREALVEDGNKVSDEFDLTIAELDRAHARLDKTLSQLKKTIVSGRYPLSRQRTNDTVTDASQTVVDDENKTLYDFIDEDNHETILSNLRALIDQYNDARGDLNDYLAKFEGSLQSVNDRLTEDAEGGLTLTPDKPTIYDDTPPSIPDIFHGMEEHATEMAGLLENLVNHYDLCVTALKHTEGGGEAAKAATADMKDATPGSEESLYGKTVAEPISENDRTNMLHVLVKDSHEVDDVVVEIRDRAGEMQEQFSLLNKYAKKARSHNQTLRQVLATMREIRTAIPGHLDAASRFREEWQNINVDIIAKTEALSGLSGFYEQFLAGYGKLLREVERRKVSELAMKKIADKARKDLERLYETDRLAREEFMEDLGEYLPRDLGAWHGLEEETTRWEVRPVFNDEDDYGDQTGDGQDQARLLDGS